MTVRRGVYHDAVNPGVAQLYELLGDLVRAADNDRVPSCFGLGLALSVWLSGYLRPVANTRCTARKHFCILNAPLQQGDESTNTSYGVIPAAA